MVKCCGWLVNFSPMVFMMIQVYEILRFKKNLIKKVEIFFVEMIKVIHLLYCLFSSLFHFGLR